ncbi:DUF885 domain-containing protein [Idiomarina xiamenensis]|uniref:Lipoprotein n=1 Tax=Idiomarina xiamenensis 10-D-4 TaxID=740709 RepID=K2KMM4_9GAMM|nr:DUF885 domain-containing protein [Idiomarina xiamenensis]EKE83679.1 hypothetical protein A10D4_07520 [Idiomarina xiamenensis 10-D-4]
MRRSLITLSLLAALAACSEPANDTNNTQANSDKAPASVNEQNTQTDKAESESERLNQWFAEKYEEQLQQSPLQMTFLGRKDRYGEIDDMSEQAQQEQLQWMDATTKELQSQFDYDKLNDTAKTSYDIWVYSNKIQQEGKQFWHDNYIFNQMHGAHSFLPQVLISFHKVDTVSDMEAFNQRVSETGRAMNQLLERAQQYAEQGTRPPRFAYEKVIDEINNLLSGQPFDDSEDDSPVWAAAKSKTDALVEAGEATAEQAQKLKDSAKQALLNEFKPAYVAVRDWLQSDIDNTLVNPAGVGTTLEDGKAYYAHQLKASTTTDLTADEIHQIGLDEVARLTKEMEAIKDQVGFDGDLQEFFKFIRTDQQFFYPNTDEGREAYLTDARDYLGFIHDQLPDYFGVLPKADLVVKRVEPFREQDGAAQHYFPGTPDGSRPGVYYAHLSDMTSMPKNEMEAIAYHEGNPGHHMQISIAQELESVPEFRKQSRFTAYVEGWALYSELLAKEMGAYENPYSDFGRLITEMWRAVRLVVDTGMHAKGWTEEQAVKYFKDHTPVAEGAVKSEIQRYLVMPGQATSYKIGMLKIIELRKKAEAALGDKFDIRGFHDTVLGGGALPLNLLERRIDQWIAEQQ